VLSDAVLCGVRTFLGLDNARPRSPNRPEEALSYTREKGASTVTRHLPTILLNKKPPVDSFVNCQISLEFFIKDIKIRIENVTLKIMESL